MLTKRGGEMMKEEHMERIKTLSNEINNLKESLEMNGLIDLHSQIKFKESLNRIVEVVEHMEQQKEDRNAILFIKALLK